MEPRCSPFFPDAKALAPWLDELRGSARPSVVFTNGCFDVLHRGHFELLARAACLGDLLVVGLNSDAGVRRLKGPTRPVNTLRDRAYALTSIRGVGAVVAFDEPTACDLASAVRPAVYVKGGDYAKEAIPEAGIVEALGGVVEIVPLVEGLSTTALLRRLR